MSPDGVKRFGERLLGIYAGAVLTKLIEIGYQVKSLFSIRPGRRTACSSHPINVQCPLLATCGSQSCAVQVRVPPNNGLHDDAPQAARA
jgi:hypothetical protein